MNYRIDSWGGGGGEEGNLDWIVQVGEDEYLL